MVKYKIKPGRGGHVRETAPKYESLPPYEPIETPPVYHVIVADRGRLVLPAEIRERLKIRDGDRVALVVEEDGTVSLKTHEVALNNLQNAFKHLAPTDHYASDDIIAERRREAKMWDREFRERTALHRRMKRQAAKRR